MPICVVGMPHSGMEVVGLALRVLGVDLGPQHDLQQGAYADRAVMGSRFASINDEILASFDVAWNSPPASNGSWASRAELEPLKGRALEVCNALALVEPWGWIDAANALTLPFWRELFPDLQVLVCIRDPLEVATALDAEGAASVPEGLELWRAYHEAIEELMDEHLVTELGRYHEEAEGELERIARKLHLSTSNDELRRAARLVESDWPGSGASDTRAGDEARPLYSRLPGRAKGNPTDAMTGGNRREGEVADRGADDRIVQQKREIAHLRRELERSRGRADALLQQLESRAGWENEREQLLATLEVQLSHRDEELQRAWQESERRQSVELASRDEVAWLREQQDVLTREVEWLREQNDALSRQIEWMHQTRVWRVGSGYWALKRLLRQPFRRNR
jgi:hypothetical protein